MIVIGIHGARGAGKDTIANRLVTQYGFECVSLADPIREALLATFHPLGLDESHFADRTAKEAPTPALNGRSPRFSMQTFGTEYLRQYMGQDILCQILAATIRKLSAAGADRFVVPDVRFANEADFLRVQLGARLWLVYRPGAHFLHNHGSEFELPASMMDRTVLNDRGLHELYARVDTLSEEVLP